MDAVGVIFMDCRLVVFAPCLEPTNSICSTDSMSTLMKLLTCLRLKTKNMFPLGKQCDDESVDTSLSSEPVFDVQPPIVEITSEQQQVIERNLYICANDQQIAATCH